MKKEYIDALNFAIKNNLCSKEEITSLSQQEAELLAIHIISTSNNIKELDVVNLIEKEQYDFKIPNIIEVIENPYYLGKVTGFPLDDSGNPLSGGERQIYDFWIDKLNTIYNTKNTYHEILVTGAIGIGKTTFLNVIIWYDLMKLLSLKNPQTYYGLMTGTRIVFAFFNITLRLAEDVAYNQLYSFINNSPFAMEVFHKNKRKKHEYQYEPGKSIDILTGSTFGHTLGQAVFEAFIDEANFGKEKIDPAKEEKISQVYKNYTNLLRRMESRFQKLSNLPGHFLMASSKQDTSSFLEEHIEKSKNNPKTLVIDAPQYEVKKCRKGLYSGKTFKVLLGDINRDPKVLQDNEEVSPDMKDFIEVVPIEHKRAYELDIIEALRDISGKSVRPKHAFITNQQIVRDQLDVNRLSPWNYNCGANSPPNTINLSFRGNDQLYDFLDTDILMPGGKLPYPSCQRFLAIDTGAVNDAVGMTMLCKCGNIVVPKDGKNIYLPKYWIDFKIRVKGIDGEELPLYKSEHFVKYLIDDLKIELAVSTDGFQSLQLRQNLKIRYSNLHVEVLSVDRDCAAHDSFKDSLYSKCFQGMYVDNNFLIELFDLVKIRGSKSAGGLVKTYVDHPQVASDKFVGRKDVTDSAVAAKALCDSIDNTVSVEESNQEMAELKNINMDKVMEDVSKEVDEAFEAINKLDI